MKKLFLLATLLIFCTSFIKAQSCSSCRVSSYNYYKYGELDKAKEMSDFCITCDKNSKDPRVWYYRGLIYEGIHLKKEFNNLDKDAVDKSFDAYKKALLFNFLDPSLQTLDIENKQEDLLNFFKALMDQKTKYTDQEITMDIIMNQYPTLANIFVNKGIDAYQNTKDYEKALKYFKNSLFVSGMSGKIDTPVIYYAGLAANKAKKFDEAKEMFQTCTKLNYGADNKEKANNYFFLADVYRSKGDTIKFVETLKKGIEKYPKDNNVLVVELINHYLATKQVSEAKNYLEIAIQNDPNNPTYHFALGTIYDSNDKNYDKAIECYKKAIELKSDVFDYQYNIGALFFNQAADLYNQANNESDNKKYQAIKNQGDEKMKLAIPYLEKAHELNPKDLPTMESLKNGYYRLQMNDKYDAMKKKIEETKK